MGYFSRLDHGVLWKIKQPKDRGHKHDKVRISLMSISFTFCSTCILYRSPVSNHLWIRFVSILRFWRIYLPFLAIFQPSLCGGDALGCKLSGNIFVGILATFWGFCANICHFCPSSGVDLAGALHSYFLSPNKSRWECRLGGDLAFGISIWYEQASSEPRRRDGSYRGRRGGC